MKKNRSNKFIHEEYEEDERKPKKKDSPRRAIRNWRREWEKHSTDYQEYDEFFGK